MTDITETIRRTEGEPFVPEKPPTPQRGQTWRRKSDGVEVLIREVSTWGKVPEVFDIRWSVPGRRSGHRRTYLPYFLDHYTYLNGPLS